MKVKKEFIVREIMGEYILIPIGSVSEKFDGLITANETGAFIWRNLADATDEEALLRLILDEYEVSEREARADLLEVLATLRENGIL